MSGEKTNKKQKKVLLICVIPDIFLILPHLLDNNGIDSVIYIIFQQPIRPVDMDWRRHFIPVTLLWHIPPVEDGKETENGIVGDR